MARHPLKREIIATHVLNSMVNRVGSTFVHRLCETTGARAHEVVRAYLLSREIFSLVPLWQAVEALDNRVADEVQSAMLIDTSGQLERGTLWFLRSRRLNDDMAATIAYFQPGVEALSARLPKLLDAAERARIDAKVAELAAVGVPRELAERVDHVRHAVRGARHRRGRGRREEAGRAGRRRLLRHRQPPGARLAARQGERAARRRALAQPREGGDAGRPVEPYTVHHRAGGGRRWRREAHRDIDRRVEGSQPAGDSSAPRNSSANCAPRRRPMRRCCRLRCASCAR